MQELGFWDVCSAHKDDEQEWLAYKTLNVKRHIQTKVHCLALCDKSMIW